MRLRRPCEHGRYEEHGHGAGVDYRICPGGEFLAEDALVIEKHDNPRDLVKRLRELGIVEVHDCATYATDFAVIRASDNARLKCEWVVPAAFTVDSTESWVSDALAVRDGEG